MRSLPPLSIGLTPCNWPLADVSAEALILALLEADRSQAASGLAACLAGDPALATWAMVMAREWRLTQPAGFSSLADMLLTHATTWLRWEAGQYDWVDDDLADRFAAAVEVGILWAEAAEAAGEDSATREAAALFAAIQGFASHAEIVGLVDAELADVLHPNHTAVIEAIASAKRLLDGGVASTIDLDACRRRSHEATQCWRTAGSEVAKCLPMVVGKLARLRLLEEQFAAAVAEEKLSALAEFAAGAGHEINNPLAVISGRAQLLLQQESDPERRRSLTLISAQTLRVHEMIADMRLFARPPQAVVQPVDIVALVDRVVGELAAAARSQETTIRHDGTSGPLELRGDALQLAVAVRAVLQNALEALGRGGHVQIKTAARHNGVELRIADNGPGMTAAECRHAFEPFFSARQAGRGIGLGLSKCWRIVTAHGGRVWVESAPGHGTMFAILLPY
jgi:signal transduction histidine kinase